MSICEHLLDFCHPFCYRLVVIVFVAAGSNYLFSISLCSGVDSLTSANSDDQKETNPIQGRASLFAMAILQIWNLLDRLLEDFFL